MAEIIIGERVTNKLKQSGTIISVDDQHICIDFGNRTAKLQLDAFDKGFLKYENPDLQSAIDKGIEKIKEEKDREAEKKRLEDEKEKNIIKMMEAQAPAGTNFNSVSMRLEPAPVTLSSVKKKHREKVQKVFDECDKDMNFFGDSFNPRMKYVTPRAAPVRTLGYFDFVYEPKDVRPVYFRSRYSAGFLAKYDGVYVLRVLSRNDLYTSGMYGGFTVSNSDTTEIIRILSIDGETYSFSKNLSCENGKYKNSLLYKRWQASTYIDLVKLDEVIRICDCGYLNNYIDTKNVNCLSYVRLLMAALYNNKAEIVFKNKLFEETSDIENISDYLEEFSSKQVDFASKNNVIHTLPIIKRQGLYDVDILVTVKALMRKSRNGGSTYSTLRQLFAQHNFDLTILDKKLIGFLRKHLVDFNIAIYGDYINELTRVPVLNVDDLFDNNYVDRHYAMVQEKQVYYSTDTSNQYSQIAQELSWIDREENDYYITIPKSIPEFKYEGHMQHHCVYTMEYFYDVIDRRSIIVFLRQEKNTPYVTIEFDYNTFEVRQAYRKFNQDVDEELYQYIVDLGKQLKLEMDSRE